MCHVGPLRLASEDKKSKKERLQQAEAIADAVAALQELRQTWLEIERRGIDTEHLLTNVRQTWGRFWAASSELGAQGDLWSQVLAQTTKALDASLARVWEDHKWVSEALALNVAVLDIAAEETGVSHGCALDAGRRHWEVLWLATSQLGACSELALEAVRQHLEALGVAYRQADADVSAVLAAARQRWAQQWLSSRELREERDAVLQAARLKWVHSWHGLRKTRCSETEAKLVKDINRSWMALVVTADTLLNDLEGVRRAAAEIGRGLQLAAELALRAPKWGKPPSTTAGCPSVPGDIGGTSSTESCKGSFGQAVLDQPAPDDGCILLGSEEHLFKDVQCGDLGGTHTPVACKLPAKKAQGHVARVVRIRV